MLIMIGQAQDAYGPSGYLTLIELVYMRCSRTRVVAGGHDLGTLICTATVPISYGSDVRPLAEL